MIDPQRYRPPFITETDELRWDDCGPCSFLMLAATWTLGEVLYLPDGDQWNLKRLRERLRNHLPADRQTGYTNIADARVYLKAEWDFLDLPYGRSDWTGILADLRSGDFAAVAQGNPKGAPADSPLRRWTNSDDFGHFVYLDRLRVTDTGTDIFVMDPLGRGDYAGQWVPASHVKRYCQDGGGIDVVTIRRGSETAAARARRKAAVRLAAVQAEQSAQLAALNARITDLEAAIIPIDDARAAERERVKSAAIAAIAAL